MTKVIGSMELIQFVVVLLFGTFIVSGVENQYSSRQQDFYAARKRALRKFAYTSKIVRSRITCGRECLRDENCRSINVYGQENRQSKICELNNATWYEHPDDFTINQSSVYFDGNKQTPLFLSDSFLANNHGSYKHQSAASGGTTIVMESDVTTTSGVGYSERFPGGLQVYRDMERYTDGGEWIVFQRRQDGSVDFNRTWAEYRSGFGNLSGEFWMGNDNLLQLLGLANPSREMIWELRIDMEDWEGNTAWAKYSSFNVLTNEYALTIGQYDVSSTAGDSLRFCSGNRFTTKDQDNDGWIPDNCARNSGGGWWYGGCGSTNLNGVYHSSPVTDGYGITWYDWKGLASLKSCSMKMREVDLNA